MLCIHFTGDPNADLDFDGQTALLEYALGTGDASTGPANALIWNAAAHTVTLDHATAADDIDLFIQSSTDLLVWQTDLTLSSSVVLTGGLSRSTWAIKPALIAAPRLFFRALVILRP